MKKFFLLATMLLVFSVMAHAQSAFFTSTTTGKTLDTVTNAGTRIQKGAIAGYQDVVSIQVNLVSKTGTPAGVVRLLGSDDGLKFVRINATDSLLVDANHLNKIFVVTPHAYTYYQASFIGSGTQSTTLQTFAIWRKR